ncbi:hypothetical protein [Aphanizomenon flos-aquae]|uniref:hypothetical protein n=1 Tax=Aphanizomenon flos-aquae TaxID=1176 RepID=UPI00057F43F3|nr:hypothetical protein [Aphanizomenon flos-aquae]MTJ29250.1 hypothetical protein [Aphanizomenon sp. UHCC 0183]
MVRYTPSQKFIGFFPDSRFFEILAGLRFEKNLIRQLLSEDIMQESVIYQDILQKGEQKGEKIGAKNRTSNLQASIDISRQ